MTAAATPVVVCVPTYRRPAQLARLLRALGDQCGAPAFEILVGNNDERALTTYAELVDDALPPFDTIRVDTRGVSAVRNALVAEALASRPAARWIACLDDDQIPSPGWLRALVATGERHDADLAGGPVLRTVADATFWSRDAADTSYLPVAEGPTPTLNEAGNLLIATRFLRGLGRAPFSLEFGRTGGEDYEFFLHARSRGARIAWAPDARVEEPLPADRVTMRGYAWRFYAIAAYQARADRRYRGVVHVLGTIARDAAKGVVTTIGAIVRGDPRRAIAALVQRASMVCGRVAGLCGQRATRYGHDPEPSAPGGGIAR